MQNKILSLDLSTTCTGYAVFDVDTFKPIAHGSIKPKVSGKAKLHENEFKLQKMLYLAQEIKTLILIHDPVLIVVEEIAGSKNRLGQKTLDGFHWIVLLHNREYIDRIHFYDVTGADGWRTHLKLRQSAADKLQNKEAKKLNKKLAPSLRLPEVTPKTLAARYCNAQFGMVLDVDRNSEDADIADALCIGHAFLQFRFANLKT